MTPAESINANDLGDAHLNYMAFLVDIDSRYQMNTVPENERQAVERARRERIEGLAGDVGAISLAHP